MTGPAGATGSFTTDVAGDTDPHPFTVGDSITLHSVPDGSYSISWNVSYSEGPVLLGMFPTYYWTNVGSANFDASSSSVQLSVSSPGDEAVVSGTATPGAVVAVYGGVYGEWSVMATTTVSDDGSFLLHGVPAGTVSVGMLAADPSSPMGYTQVGDPQMIVLIAGTNTVTLP